MEAQCIGELEGVIFCLAKSQDYDEVMAISHDVYQGNDYLPHMYHTWMTEQDRVVIIGRRNGKLVAFDSALVVDGGQTVVLEGLRVCPSERGHGVAGLIQRVTDDYIKKVYPNVTIKRLTRCDNPGPEKLSKFKIFDWRAVLTLSGEAERFKSFVSGLKARLESTKKPDEPINNKQKFLVLKNIHDLKKILLDPELPLRLKLPGGAIIQDWQPLRLMESNLKIFERRNLTWLVECLNYKPMFISLHTPLYPIPFNGGSLRFSIDMFGTDVSFARNALVTHLEQVIEDINCTVLVHVYMPQAFKEAMIQFCEGYEGIKEMSVFPGQLFLEKELS